MTVPIVSRVQEVLAIVDVPYNFKDEKGEVRSGVTRKIAFVEFDAVSGAITGLLISKADPSFTCNLKQRGVLGFDRFGRVNGFQPLSGDD